jgi:hypothetical protein
MANYNTYLLDKNGKQTTDLKKGDLYVSVSTVLKMEGKDLIKWALKSFGTAENPLKAYDNYMERVSSLGSRIHAYVEKDLKGETIDETIIQEDELPAIEAWHNFKDQHSIKLVASERTVFSPRYRVAGTCDLVCELDGRLVVADFKTGSVYPSAFTQMAAYKSFMVEEPKESRLDGIKDAELMVINIHRDGKPVEVHTIDSYYGGLVSIDDELGMFHALRFAWYLRNVKSKKWQPVIKNMQDILSPLNKKFKDKFKLN